MLFALLLTALTAQNQAAPAVPEATDGPEILVVAKRGKCRVRFANRMLSDRELDASAREWAKLGRPVRVVAPRGAGYKCLAKIAFSLRGVRLIHWVDSPDEP